MKMKWYTNYYIKVLFKFKSTVKTHWQKVWKEMLIKGEIKLYICMMLLIVWWQRSEFSPLHVRQKKKRNVKSFVVVHVTYPFTKCFLSMRFMRNRESSPKGLRLRLRGHLTYPPCPGVLQPPLWHTRSRNSRKCYCPLNSNLAFCCPRASPGWGMG